MAGEPWGKKMKQQFIDMSEVLSMRPRRPNTTYHHSREGWWSYHLAQLDLHTHVHIFSVTCNLQPHAPNNSAQDLLERSQLRSRYVLCREGFHMELSVDMLWGCFCTVLLQFPPTEGIKSLSEHISRQRPKHAHGRNETGPITYCGLVLPWLIVSHRQAKQPITFS